MKRETFLCTQGSSKRHWLGRVQTRSLTLLQGKSCALLEKKKTSKLKIEKISHLPSWSGIPL